MMEHARRRRWRLNTALLAAATASFGFSWAAHADWTTSARFSEARPGLAAAALDGRVYAAGGVGLLAPSSSLDAYELATGSWRALAPLPEGRARFGMAALDGLLYVAGGVTEIAGATDTAWTYDPARDVWDPLPPMPSARSGHGVLAAAGKLYALGGDTPGMDVFDPEDRTWSTLEAPAAIARPGAAVAVFQDRLYVIGGREGDAASARVDVYDPTANSWSRGADLPGARMGLGAVSLAGALHVFGGSQAAGREVSTAHYVLAAAGGAWREDDALPAPRTDFATTVLDDAIIVLGGGSGGGFLGPFTSIDTVDVYRP